MLKNSGFTLIELMSVIAILGILFLATVPHYQNLREQNDFRAQNQAVWDQMATARSAALTNKKCPDDSIAVAWQVVLGGITNDIPLTHTLNCINGPDFSADVVNVEATTVLSTTEVDALQIESTVVPDLATYGSATLKINFLSGSAQTRIELLRPAETPPDDDVRIDNFRIVLGHTDAESDLQHTICLNRVGGFPTLNKYGTICEEDV